MKRIDIIVSPQGEVNLQTHGYAGRECQQASKAMEEALGLHQREQLTGEYHQLPRQLHQEHQA